MTTSAVFSASMQRIIHLSTQNVVLVAMFLVSLLASLSSPSFVVAQGGGGSSEIEDYSCDVLFDSCGSRFNQICDSNLGDNPLPGCETSDCGDCDLCRQFDADCEGCLNANGCNWCPGDATCFNSPLYIFPPPSISSCPNSNDFQQGGTCTEPENYFK